MKMRTSWKKRTNAEMGVGTMIIFIAMVLVAAVAASVLISTANKVREQAQNTGDQAINNVASGFVVQDVTGQVLADRSAIKNLTIQVRLQAGSPAVNMDKVTVQFISSSTNHIMKMQSGTVGGGTTITARTLDLTNAFFNAPADPTIYGTGKVRITNEIVTVAGSLPNFSITTANGTFASGPGSHSLNAAGVSTPNPVNGTMSFNEVSSSGPGASPTTLNYIANQTLAMTIGGVTWSSHNYVVQQGDMITISICNDAGNLNLGFTQSATIKIVPAYGSPTTINFVTPSYYSTDYVNLK